MQTYICLVGIDRLMSSSLPERFALPRVPRILCIKLYTSEKVYSFATFLCGENQAISAAISKKQSNSSTKITSGIYNFICGHLGIFRSK